MFLSDQLLLWGCRCIDSQYPVVGGGGGIGISEQIQINFIYKL